MAQYDQDSIVVYQAYNTSIGTFASHHGFFGDEFQMGRMSWIKPNYLWMMYRSSWGTAPGQEVVLAVKIRRAAFDRILALAVHSSFVESIYGTTDQWKRDVASSQVRLQWDPDHLPSGEPTERRAVQLGLRGETLRLYSKEWIVDIEDISPFVASQRERAKARGSDGLLTPCESPYLVVDPATRERLGVEPCHP